MRLIDADKLNMNDMCDHCRSACCVDCIGNEEFAKWTESIPTAYDPDKVVEQLKQLRTDETPEWNAGYYTARYEAIKVVKKGGA